MLIERSLECSPTSNDKFFKRSKDTSLAENFLKKHKAAKIIVIVDTHCLENGYFVWTGDSPQDYRACSLLEVSTELLSSPFCSLTPSTDLTRLQPKGDIPIPV